METGKLKTLIYKVDPVKPDPDIIEETADIIRLGGVVAFPTETVYGLGADTLNPEAIEKLFAAKGRPGDNPLIAHIAKRSDLEKLAWNLPAEAVLLAEQFWPGPLTLVLPRRPEIPDIVSAGLPTVAVRMPAHPVALALIEAAGVPVAAPSANLSGRPSPTTAAHVISDLDGRIEAILDGGPCEVGLESTVLDLSGKVPLLLRPGGITMEDLGQVLPEIEADPALKSDAWRPKSPGMKYSHYKPKAEMLLITGAVPAIGGEMASLVQQLQDQGKRVGVMVTDELIPHLEKHDCHPDFLGHLGSRDNLSEAAVELFGLLRECDQRKMDIVLAEGVPETGMGLAVMNRLRKAASHRILLAR